MNRRPGWTNGRIDTPGFGTIQKIGAAGLAMALVVIFLVPSATAPVEDPDLPASCDANGRVAPPYTSVQSGNGAGNVWQLYASAPEAVPLEPYSKVYVAVSWNMATNNLDNGADAFDFGVEAVEDYGPTTELWATNPDTGSGAETGGIRGECKYVGEVLQSNGAAADFEWYVQGGAEGVTGSWSCSRTSSWQTTAGVQISITDAGAEYEISLSESFTCSEGGHIDSELLFDQTSSGY